MPATAPTAQPPAKLPDRPPAAHPVHTASTEPWYQSIWDTTKAIHDGIPAASRDMTHALTMGFDEDVTPIPGALILSYRKGIPFGEAHAILKRQLQEDRHKLEEQHPTASNVGTVAGVLANAGLSGNVFSGAKGLLPYVGDVAAGATLGGITSFGLSEGDLQRRLDDARKGAEWGGALTAAIPYVGRMIGGIYRSLRPAAQVDRKAGQAIGEAVGGHTPNFEQAPVGNFPLGTGSATNEPGLAAIERRAATTNEGNQGAVAIRQGQQQAIVGAATTPQTAAVTLASRPVPQLASRLMPPSQASGRLQDAFRRAWTVFKQEEGRLWNTPNLAGKTMDIPALQARITAARNALPPRVTRQIQNNGALQGTLDDIATLPNHATVADINAIRSDLLGIARTATDPFDRRVAGDMAAELTRAIESNPAMRSDPAAWADYVAARNFTRQMWQTIGQRPFQNIIRQGSDPRNAGSSLFTFGPQRTGERIPGGVADVIDGLNNIRQQWTALGHTGLDPRVADAAQRELGQGAVDYIINNMIRPIEQSQTGAEVGHLNRLVQWIDANRGWLTNSRLLGPEQFEILQAIRDSAAMGARVGNLRGGRGSETAERLLGGGNPRIVDIFSTALNKRLFALGGAAIGSIFGHWGEMGIGAILGWEAAHGGQNLLYRLYEMPTERLRQRLIEAAQNPEIARDLMQRAQDFRNISEATRRWLQGISEQLGAHTEHTLSPDVPR